MILIDTNILLSAVNRDDKRSASAVRALEDLVNSNRRWALSWGIAHEFLRVATHSKVLSSPLECDSAWLFITELIQQPNCLIITETEVHQETFDQCLREIPRIRGNQLHDFHLAVLMREHGIKHILTEDRDFRMFPWITIETLA